MKHILIVDDDKTSVVVAQAVLSKAYQVTTKNTGAQALEFLEENTVDLILLDINMPEMNGFSVMERIREDTVNRDTPIIFLTADNEARTEILCLDKGAIDFIGKPFVAEVMLSRVGRALELEGLRKSLANKLQEKIEEITEFKSKARRDGLTGLWNRTYAEECVDALLREKKKGALFMMDMDNFKAINDNFGHIAGDHALKIFADTLLRFSEKEDVACRMGGDEFVLFVTGENDKELLSGKAVDIIKDLSDKIGECGFELSSSISIGIALAPEDGEVFRDLYNAADKALYYVKQNGKNGYHFYSEQHISEPESDDKLVDLQYLRDMMNKTDMGRGAYLLDFTNFHHVYNFIRRCVERSNREVQIMLFTLSPSGDFDVDTAEVDEAVELLEQAIFISLRKVDVSTRYSSRQVLLILMDIDSHNGDMVAERIMDRFKELYTADRLSIHYGIVQMESKIE